MALEGRNSSGFRYVRGLGNEFREKFGVLGGEERRSETLTSFATVRYGAGFSVTAFKPITFHFGTGNGLTSSASTPGLPSFKMPSLSVR